MHLRKSIDKLEELILSGTRVPLTGQTLVDEAALLEQLDEIRVNLPKVVAEAEALIQQRDSTIAQARQYARDVVASAERRAAQLLHNSGILQQAEQQADQIRDRAQHERQELIRQAMGEAQQIRSEVDRYADQVLQDLEQRLSQSLVQIRNGREHLNT